MEKIVTPESDLLKSYNKENSTDNKGKVKIV